MSDDTDRFKFPGERLTVDGDFDSWSFIAESYFAQQDVYGFVDGSEKAPQVPETGATTEQMKAFAEWKRKDSKTMIMLLGGLHKTMVQIIMASLPVAVKDRTAAMAYQAIQDHFRPNIIAHTMQLQEELIGRRLREGEKVLNYFNEVDALVRRLCVAERKTYSIDELFKYVTQGLPKAYSSIVDNLYGIYGKKELTIQALRSILLEKEQQLEAEAAAESFEARAFSLKPNFGKHPQHSHGRKTWPETRQEAGQGWPCVLPLRRGRSFRRTVREQGTFR